VTILLFSFLEAKHLPDVKHRSERYFIGLFPNSETFSQDRYRHSGLKSQVANDAQLNSTRFFIKAAELADWFCIRRIGGLFALSIVK